MGSILDALFRGIAGAEGQPSPPTAGKREKVESQEDDLPSARTPSQQLTAHHSTPITVPSQRNDNGKDVDPIAPTDDLPLPIDADQTMSTPSFDRSTSLSTAGMDLSFGSQPIPFILRRRVTTGETPSRAPANTPASLPHLRSKSMAIVIRPDPDDQSVEIVEEMLLPMQQPTAVPVSAWRKEQLKYVKRARVGKDAKEKPVPSLHGPLSLPYARNPSGVDATIADDAAYLSNVFGLRAAAHVRLHPTDTIRVTSTGTTISNTSTEDSRHTNQSAPVPSIRPLVIKDPHQMLGLRHGKTQGDQGFADQPPRATVYQSAGNGILHEPPATFTAKAQDPFEALVEQALDNAGRKRAMSSDSVSGSHLSSEGFSNQLRDRTTLTEIARLLREHLKLTGLDDQELADRSSDLAGLSIRPHATPGTVSKADASANWRAKVTEDDSDSTIPLIALGSPEPQTFGPPINDLLEELSGPDDKENVNLDSAIKDVTIIADDKGHAVEGHPITSKKGFRQPLGESTSLPGNAAAPAAKETPPSSVVRAAIRKATVTAAKGTPDAGKLLKRKSLDGVLKKADVKVEKSDKGKGKAAAK